MQVTLAALAPLRPPLPPPFTPKDRQPPTLRPWGPPQPRGSTPRAGDRCLSLPAPLAKREVLDLGDAYQEALELLENAALGLGASSGGAGGGGGVGAGASAGGAAREGASGVARWAPGVMSRALEEREERLR